MANQDGSKTECFRLWSAGASIEEIERQVTAKPESVRDWVLQWERAVDRPRGSQTSGKVRAFRSRFSAGEA